MAASIKKTVEIIFSVQGAKFYANLDKISNRMDIFSDKASSITSPLDKISNRMDVFFDRTSAIANPLANLADIILKVQAAVVSLTTAFSVFSIQEAAKLETSIVSLNKVLEEHEVYYIRNNIKSIEELSLKYGITTVKIIDSIAEFKKAGFSLQDAIKLQVDALDLAIAGELEAAQAAKVLASTIIGFSVEAKEARSIIDAINFVANNFATTAGELAIALSKLAPIANLAGLSINETIGLVTPIIEVFRSGTEASNAMKAALQRLVAPARRSADILENMGVAITKSNGKMRSAKDIYFDVAKALNSMEKEEALVIVRWLVGIHQAGRVAHAMKNLEKSYKITETAINSTGSAQYEVNLILNTTQKEMQRVARSLEHLSVAFGDRLLPDVSRVSAGLITVNTALKEVLTSDQFKPFFEFIDKQTLDLQAFLFGVADALPAAFNKIDFSVFTSQLELVIRKIVGLNDLDFTKPEDLAKAIQYVINSLGSLTVTFGGTLSQMGVFFKEILAAINTFNNLDDSVKFAVGEIAALSKAISIVVPIVSELTVALKTLAVVFAAMGGIVLIKNVSTLVGAFGRLGIILGVLLSSTQFLKKNLVGLIPIFKTFGVALSLFTGFKIGEWLVENIDLFRKFSEEIRGWFGTVLDYFDYGVDDKLFDDVQRKMERLRELYKDTVTPANYDALWQEHLRKLRENQIEVEAYKDNTELLEIEHQKFLQQLRTGHTDWLQEQELSENEFRERAREAAEKSVLLPDENVRETVNEAAKEAAREAAKEATKAAAKAAKEAAKDKKVDVSVDLKGVEPELEAFVWKLIERAQYSAVSEGQELLIGLPVEH